MNYYEKIAELIFNHVRKPLNKEFIEELIKIIIAEEKLEEENLIDPNIIIYKAIYFDDACYMEFVPDKNFVPEYYTYLYATRLILTLLEKRKMRKEVISAPHELQNRILSASFEQNQKIDQFFACKSTNKRNRITKQMKIYRNNKEAESYYSPEQLYSKIFAYETLMEITELLEEYELQMIHKIELNDIFITAYQSLKGYFTIGRTSHKSPTLYYLEQIGCKKRILKTIQKEAKNLDNIAKLKLGLEVSDDVLSKIRVTQSELKRVLHINK